MSAHIASFIAVRYPDILDTVRPIPEDKYDEGALFGDDPPTPDKEEEPQPPVTS